MVSLLARVSDNEEVKHFLRFHKGLKEKQRLKEAQVLEPAYHSSIQSDTAGQYLSSSSTASHAPFNLHPVSSPMSNASTNISTDTLIQELSSKPTSGSRLSLKSTKSTKTNRSTRNRSFFKSDWKFLSFDYATIDWLKEDPVVPLGSLSVTAQENVLIEDLLHVLVGIEGLYIRMQPAPESTKKNIMCVDDSADKLLKTLATKITNLCPLYSNVIFFIDQMDNGLVNQALAAAMRGVIKDYFILIAQLESQYRRNDLTIQKMWYYLQPFFTNLEILKYFSSTIHNVRTCNSRHHNTN